MTQGLRCLTASRPQARHATAKHACCREDFPVEREENHRPCAMNQWTEEPYVPVDPSLVKGDGVGKTERALRVLIVDGDSSGRDVLAGLLRENLKAKAIFAEDVEGGAALYAENTPDIVMTEILFSGLSGFELIRRILALNPAAKVIAHTACTDAVYGIQALRAGALAFVQKGGPDEELLSAIAKVRSGGKYISHDMAVQMIVCKVSATDQAAQLSPRELELLRLLGMGKPLAVISEMMGISPKTTANIRSTLKAKLGLDDAADLKRYAAARLVTRG